MNYMQAIVLGILQGLTEFLPVSSSGHLVLVEKIMGIHPSTALNVGLHLGTLAAVVIYYRRDIVALVRAVPDALRLRSTPDAKMIWWLALATAVTAPIGLMLEHPMEDFFAGPWGYAGLAASFGTTALLLWGSRRARPADSWNWLKAAGLGVVQGLAVIPGISRSGSTITAAMFMGITPVQAARFSFLMSVPAIGGAALLEARKMAEVQPGPMLAGMVTSSVVGYLALVWLMKLVEAGRLSVFSWYVGILATVSLVLHLF